MKKVCVVTGNRAEYGLLRTVIADIISSSELSLQLVVTGSHLSPEFGQTSREIEDDGYVIDRRVEMLLSSNSSVGVCKSMGLGIIGFGDVLSELQPDILLVLGDRYEIFSAAATAMTLCIPIAHIHGGESTEGAIDEAIRHSITKMSHLHFVAADEYLSRVIQLGEDPSRVFNVGGLGVDAIARLRLMGKSELENSLDFKFGDKNLIITYHPVTLDSVTSTSELNELLSSLSKLEDTKLIFTMPNADAGGRELCRMIEIFVKSNSNAVYFESLGQLRYLSALQYVDGVIGNSSSGLLEAPSMSVGTINMGERQAGRLKADSVIDCTPERNSISDGINKLYSNEFQKAVQKQLPPYGRGGASKKIIEILANCDHQNLLRKKFNDLPVVHEFN